MNSNQNFERFTRNHNLIIERALSEGESDLNNDEIPTRTINTSSSNFAPLITTDVAVIMMATDWIPTEPLPAGPQVDEEEFQLQQQRLDHIVPKWAIPATNNKEHALMNEFSKVPFLSNDNCEQIDDQPIR